MARAPRLAATVLMVRVKFRCRINLHSWDPWVVISMVDWKQQAHRVRKRNCQFCPAYQVSDESA